MLDFGLFAQHTGLGGETERQIMMVGALAIERGLTGQSGVIGGEVTMKFDIIPVAHGVLSLFKIRNDGERPFMTI